MHAFSFKSFRQQFEVPGITVLSANFKSEAIGMIIWYVYNKIAYYHLGAYSELGYEMKASFGLFHNSIGYFQKIGLESLNLGSGAGIRASNSDGLSKFKKGWSNGIRTSYLCGKIFNNEIYSQILNNQQVGITDYFPAYRAGEFI